MREFLAALAGEQLAAVNWDRVLLVGLLALGVAVKLAPKVWPYVAPYVLRPIVAVVDAVEALRRESK